MYIDESGDVGITNSPTEYFIISALVIHESNWLNFLDDLIVFRKYLRDRFGLRLKEEIHASDFVNGRVNLRKDILKNDRIDILKKSLKWLNSRNDISIITVRCKKNNRADVFDFTWRVLIQRLENTLIHGNFPGGFAVEKGIILADNTDGGKLTKLLRKMRRFNPTPHNYLQYGTGSRNLRLSAIIEDPVLRDSSNSFVHQMVDIIAYFGRQYYEPNRYIRKKGVRTFYNFIESITNAYATRNPTPNKIVEV